MDDETDEQQAYWQVLEQLARRRHGIPEDRPVPLELLPTPLWDLVHGDDTEDDAAGGSGEG